MNPPNTVAVSGTIIRCEEWKLTQIREIIVAHAHCALQIYRTNDDLVFNALDNIEWNEIPIFRSVTDTLDTKHGVLHSQLHGDDGKQDQMILSRPL